MPYGRAAAHALGVEKEVDKVFAIHDNENTGHRHVAQGESTTLTRWGSRVQIPACLPFFIDFIKDFPVHNALLT
jgi:hypothetical protein